MSGIPWRFDVENMPKDGSHVLLVGDLGTQPVVAFWGEECGTPDWCLTRSTTSEGLVEALEYYRETVLAWCPIDEPAPTS